MINYEMMIIGVVHVHVDNIILVLFVYMYLSIITNTCYFPIEGEEVHWVQCDQCELWFHLLCIGLGKEEVSEEVDYICYTCSHKSSPCSADTLDDIHIKQEPMDDEASSEVALSSNAAQHNDIDSDLSASTKASQECKKTDGEICADKNKSHKCVKKRNVEKGKLALDKCETEVDVQQTEADDKEHESGTDEELGEIEEETEEVVHLEEECERDRHKSDRVVEGDSDRKTMELEKVTEEVIDSNSTKCCSLPLPVSPSIPSRQDNLNLNSQTTSSGVAIS